MALLISLLAVHALLCLGFVAVTTAMLLAERGQPLRPDRTVLGWLSREWGAAMVMVPLRVVGLWQPRPRRSHGGSGPHAPQAPVAAPATLPPVLLVPGYSMNRGCFQFLALYLRRRGWRWVWPINNVPFSSPIPVLAHSLARRVQELREASGAPQVDIVAHSMGGVLAAWYVNHLGGDAYVRRVVTLGTPWAGTRQAVFGMRREVRDLLPDSPIIQSLGPVKVSLVSIWSQDDAIVLPPESARRLDAPSPAVRRIGHMSLLMSAQAFRLVLQALERADLPRTEEGTGAHQGDTSAVPFVAGT